MSAATPWGFGSFPSHCRHCGAVTWFSPMDVLPPVRPCCGAAYDYLPSGRLDDAQDIADAWWQNLARGILIDSRREAIQAIETLPTPWKHSP